MRAPKIVPEHSALSLCLRRLPDSNRSKNPEDPPRLSCSERISGAELQGLLVARDGDACFYCGNAYAFYHSDHVTPRSRQGSDAPGNRVLACPTCNFEKGTHGGWLYVLLREFGPVPARLPLPPAPSDASDWLSGKWIDDLVLRAGIQRAATAPHVEPAQGSVTTQREA